MVEIFKTNIRNAVDAEIIRNKIFQQFPYLNVNFDLEDCDHILRVEIAISLKTIINIVQEHNYQCVILE